MISLADACTCPKSYDSGRSYAGYRACRLCGRSIVSNIAKLRQDAEDERVAEFHSGRTKVKGGLHIDGELHGHWRNEQDRSR